LGRRCRRGRLGEVGHEAAARRAPVCAEVQAHGFLVREQTRCKRMGGGGGSEQEEDEEEGLFKAMR